MLFKLVLIRHGESTANQKNVIAGTENVTLTEKEIKELLQLKEKINYPKTDSYYCSDLIRTEETLKLLFPNESYEILSQIREINFGDAERQDIQRINLDRLFLNWIMNEDEYNMEAHSDVLKRFLEAIIYASSKSNSATFVSHGGTIKAIIHHLKKMNPTDFLLIKPIRNGKGYIVDLEITGINVSLLKMKEIW